MLHHRCTLFYNQHFYKQRQAEIDKKVKHMLSNTLRLNFCFLKIIHILHPRYRPKIIGHIIKSKPKNKCVCIHEITQLIVRKMKMKMKNRSHRYDRNRPRFKHRHQYGKYKICLSMMMLICFQEQLSNIWSSIHRKVKQHWGWVQYKKSM